MNNRKQYANQQTLPPHHQTETHTYRTREPGGACSPSKPPRSQERPSVIQSIQGARKPGETYSPSKPPRSLEKPTVHLSCRGTRRDLQSIRAAREPGSERLTIYPSRQETRRNLQSIQAARSSDIFLWSGSILKFYQDVISKLKYKTSHQLKIEYGGFIPKLAWKYFIVIPILLEVRHSLLFSQMITTISVKSKLCSEVLKG